MCSVVSQAAIIFLVKKKVLGELGEYLCLPFQLGSLAGTLLTELILVVLFTVLTIAILLH